MGLIRREESRANLSSDKGIRLTSDSESGEFNEHGAFILVASQLKS
jgi:hypothetical protein